MIRIAVGEYFLNISKYFHEWRHSDLHWSAAVLRIVQGNIGTTLLECYFLLNSIENPVEFKISPSLPFFWQQWWMSLSCFCFCFCLCLDNWNTNTTGKVFMVRMKKSEFFWQYLSIHQICPSTRGKKITGKQNLILRLLELLISRVVIIGLERTKH